MPPKAAFFHITEKENTMTLIELAEKIDVKKIELIPKGMFAYYPVPEERKSECCSIEMIERLQEKYDFFGDYAETAKAYWRATEQNELYRTYIDAASLFVKDGEYDDIRRTKLVDPAGTPETDFFPLFIHLPTVEKAIEDYVKRGFSEEEAVGYLHSYRNHIANMDKLHGRPFMSRSYVSWLCHYIKSLLFQTGGFNFELHPFRNANVIQNKLDSSLAILAANGAEIHKSGLILGSAGAMEEEGSLKATFEETDDAFIGYPVQKNLFTFEKNTYPKKDWNVLMYAEDTCVGIHIPRDCDITDDAFTKAMQNAKEILKNGYSDYSPKMFACGSWLLSPELEEILKPGSKILGFGRRFQRLPLKDPNGGNARGFIFPNLHDVPTEELPEETSLQRGAKKIMMEGRAIHMFSGVIEY